MTPEEAEVARLLRLARQADLPDAARLARVRARFLPPPAAAPVASQEVATASTHLGALGAKIIVGVAAVGLAFWAPPDVPQSALTPTPEHEVETLPPAATDEAVEQPDAPLPAATEAPPQTHEAVEQPDAPLRAATEVPPQMHGPVEQPDVPQPSARPPRKRVKTAREPPAPAPTLADEAAMLQMAAVALRAGQLDRAGETLAEFARRFPDSQLTADRLKLEQRLLQLRLPAHR